MCRTLITRPVSRRNGPPAGGWRRPGPGGAASGHGDAEWRWEQRWQEDCDLQVANAYHLPVRCHWGEWTRLRFEADLATGLQPLIILWPRVSAFHVLQKANFEDQIMVSNLTSGVYKFQLTVTDTIGQSDSTKVTLLVLTPEQSERKCLESFSETRGGRLAKEKAGFSSVNRGLLYFFFYNSLALFSLVFNGGTMGKRGQCLSALIVFLVCKWLIFVPN